MPGWARPVAAPASTCRRCSAAWDRIGAERPVGAAARQVK